MGLTIKQEKFCCVYIETSNASEAYRQAYNAENMNEATINKRASELLKNGAVTGRLDELRANHAERHNTTVDDLIEELNDTRNVALSALIPQCSAAIAATMGKAKLLGFIDKKEENKDKDDLASALNKLIDRMPN